MAKKLLTLSALSLVLANCVPLLGVIFFEWDLRQVMLLYWAESGVIGFYGILAMRSIGGSKAIPTCIFFVFHFGLFMFVHLMFLVLLTAPGGMEATPASAFGSLGQVLSLGWVLALAGLFLSHGISFVQHRGERLDLRGDDATSNMTKQMNRPYRRIVVMQVTLIAGAGLVMFTGVHVLLLALLIVIKTIVDLRAHRKEHRWQESLV